MNYKLSGVIPVPLRWANTTPEPTAKYLPTPEHPERYGFYLKRLYADSEITVMLPDGSIWKYKGISGYKIDNEDRINGWLNVTSDFI